MEQYQQMSPDEMMMVDAFSGIGVGIFIFSFIFAIAAYVFFSYCLMRMANRIGAENTWFAWLPILNVILMFRMAGKPIMWFWALVGSYFLILILTVVFPPAGMILGLVWGIACLVLGVMIWMAIAEELGHPSWWGIITVILPAVGYPYLAFAD